MERPRLGATFAAFAVYAVAVTFSVGGLTDGRPWGNGTPYYDSLNVLDGLVPYRDFSLEYPPLALPVFLAPHLWASAGLIGYVHAFKLLMVALGAVTLALAGYALRKLDTPPRRRAAALLAIAVTPAAIGPFFLNRYDLWPTALLIAALIAALDARPAWAGALLALSVTAKFFAVAAVPVFAIYLLRRGGRRALRRATVSAAVTTVAVFGYFLVVAPKGLAVSAHVQLTRHLETESAGGAILLALDRLGLYSAHVIAGNPGSIDLAGTIADAVGVASSVLVVLVVAALAMRFARDRSPTPHAFAVAVTAAIVAYVALTKVISPQYLVWLIPLIPLVRGRLALCAAALFLSALCLSQVEGYGFDGLSIATWSIVVLVVRNALLLGLVIVCATAQQRESASATRSRSASLNPV